MKRLSPVGSSLPPRRDQLVQAREATPNGGQGGSIIVPMAQDRMRAIFEREQGPDKVRQALTSAFTGDMQSWELVMDAMLDSWPMLQKNINEVGRLTSIEIWEAFAFARRGEKPTPEAEAIADDVYDAIVTGMLPDPGTSQQDFEGMIIEMVRSGYFGGHYVGEILYERRSGEVRIKGVDQIKAPRYAYPYEGVDRLKIDLSPNNDGITYEDFPANHFLIAINKGHSGHASVSAPLRALTCYWLAAIFGMKWFMNFAQLFGVPWRHAKVPDLATDGRVVEATMATIGSAGYLVTNSDVTIDTLEAPSTGGNLPQKELLELADRMANLFISGQTLTSGTDGSGSRALGDVHADTKREVVRAAADFCGKIITRQLVPAYIRVNYGRDRDDAPSIWPKRDEVKDEKAMAERDEKLGITSGATPVESSWFYERHGIPQPAADAKLFQPVANGAQGDPAPGAGLPHETKTGLETPLKIAAADNETVKELLARMESVVEDGSLIDDDAIASLLASAWVTAAKEDHKES